MKLILLDRDGVINQDSKDYILQVDQWKPIEGSVEAIALLTQASYDIVVVTNQSAIGRGMMSVETLNAIHHRMLESIQKAGGRIHSIAFCPHHPEENCDCRKPKTGLYKTLQKKLNISFNKVYSVGDSLRDLIAAKKAGAIPVLVHTGNGEKTKALLNKDNTLENTLQFDNLLSFTHYLIEKPMS